MVIADKVKKLIFFNSPSEIDDYLANDKKGVGTNAPDRLFIAMNPTVHSYLKKKSYIAHNTLPYFNNESHIKALERSEIVMDWLRRNSEFVDLGMGIRRAYRDSFIYWTRLAIHYCLWTIEVVSNAVDMHKPEILSASLSDKKFVSSLLIEPEEKYLGYIVKIIAQQKRLRNEDISAGRTDNKDVIFLKFQFGLKFILKLVDFKLWERTIVSRRKILSNRPIIITTKPHQIDDLVKQLQENLKGKPSCFLKDPVVCSFGVSDAVINLFWKKYSKKILEQKKILKSLEVKIREKGDIFTYRNVSFSEVISQKLQDNISSYILGEFLWSIGLNQFLDAAKPFVIISSGNRLDDMILAELCKQKKITTILISHGSLVKPRNKYESIEWGEQGKSLLRIPFSFLALQTPLAEGYLDVFPSEGQVIKTGPLIWGKYANREASKYLFKKMFNSEYNSEKIKIVLHAGTPKRSKGLRLYVYETPDEYIQSLCDLANAIEKIPNTILIIKFRPQSEISVNDLKNLVPFSEKVILSVDEPFLDVLGISNLLVSFSSTTIEESLQNRVPVLLYGGGGRYQHVPAYEIKPGNSIQPSAVYHVKEAWELENAIHKILNLNIDIKKEENLFEPYIYAKDVRTSLVDLLKVLSEKEERKLF